MKPSCNYANQLVHKIKCNYNTFSCPSKLDQRNYGCENTLRARFRLMLHLEYDPTWVWRLSVPFNLPEVVQCHTIFTEQSTMHDLRWGILLELCTQWNTSNHCAIKGCKNYLYWEDSGKLWLFVHYTKRMHCLIKASFNTQTVNKDIL